MSIKNENVLNVPHNLVSTTDGKKNRSDVLSYVHIMANYFCNKTNFKVSKRNVYFSHIKGVTGFVTYSKR